MILEIKAPKKRDVQVVCPRLEDQLGKLGIGYNSRDEIDGILKQIRESTGLFKWL